MELILLLLIILSPFGCITFFILWRLEKAKNHKLFVRLYSDEEIESQSITYQIPEEPEPVPQLHPAPIPVVEAIPTPPQPVDSLPLDSQPIKSQHRPDVEKTVSTGISINIILGLGSLLVILAGIIFATTSWDDLNNLSKIAFLFGFSLFFYLVSFLSHYLLKIPRTGTAFYIVGSIYLPICNLAMGYMELYGEWFSLNGPGAPLIMMVSCLLVGLSSQIAKKIYHAPYLGYVFWSSITGSCLFLLEFFHLSSSWHNLLLAAYGLMLCLLFRFVRAKVSQNPTNTLSLLNDYLPFNQLFILIFTLSHYEHSWLMSVCFLLTAGSTLVKTKERYLYLFQAIYVVAIWAACFAVPLYQYFSKSSDSIFLGLVCIVSGIILLLTYFKSSERTNFKNSLYLYSSIPAFFIGSLCLTSSDLEIERYLPYLTTILPIYFIAVLICMAFFTWMAITQKNLGYKILFYLECIILTLALIGGIKALDITNLDLLIVCGFALLLGLFRLPLFKQLQENYFDALLCLIILIATSVDLWINSYELLAKTLLCVGVFFAMAYTRPSYILKSCYQAVLCVPSLLLIGCISQFITDNVDTSYWVPTIWMGLFTLFAIIKWVIYQKNTQKYAPEWIGALGMASMVLLLSFAGYPLVIEMIDTNQADIFSFPLAIFPFILSVLFLPKFYRFHQYWGNFLMLLGFAWLFCSIIPINYSLVQYYDWGIKSLVLLPFVGLCLLYLLISNFCKSPNTDLYRQLRIGSFYFVGTSCLIVALIFLSRKNIPGEISHYNLVLAIAASYIGFNRCRSNILTFLPTLLFYPAISLFISSIDIINAAYSDLAITLSGFIVMIFIIVLSWWRKQPCIERSGANIQLNAPLLLNILAPVFCMPLINDHIYLLPIAIALYAISFILVPHPPKIQLAAWTIFSFSCCFFVYLQDIIPIPKNYLFSYQTLCAIAFLLSLSWIYQAYQKAIYIIQICGFSLISLIFFIHIVLSNNLTAHIIYGFLAVFCASFGFYKKRFALFSLGFVSLTALLVYESRNLWGRFPWWAYLLIWGLLFMAFAAIKEVRKRTNKPGWDIKNRLKRHFDKTI